MGIYRWPLGCIHSLIVDSLCVFFLWQKHLCRPKLKFHDRMNPYRWEINDSSRWRNSSTLNSKYASLYFSSLSSGY
jgi:hypothetical protein